MATHCGILPWRIHKESWRVGHNWATFTFTFIQYVGPSSQGYGFSSSHVWMWELNYKESWAPKNWCFWTVVLEKTLESPLDCKEIQPVHAETPLLWPVDVKNWLHGKDSDAGKDLRQEEKGTTEDEVVGWNHRLNGHEFEQALEVGDGQASLACCSPWGLRELDTTERLNWTDFLIFVFISITPGVGLKRILLWFMSKSVLPLFSSKSFIVSSLIFISLIHFSSFLCMMLKNVLISFFFTCRCPVSQAPCTEETVFSPLYSLAPFVVD